MVISMRRHVACLASEAGTKMFGKGNRRPISMTNHRGNLLNQHTWMAQSKRSVFANCTGWECVSVSHRGREVKGEKKKKKEKRAIRSKQSQREIHFPVCMTTSLQGHQKQIRCRSKWPREIVSGNSRGQSADLSGGEGRVQPESH